MSELLTAIGSIFPSVFQKGAAGECLNTITHASPLLDSN